MFELHYSVDWSKLNDDDDDDDMIPASTMKPQIRGQCIADCGRTHKVNAEVEISVT